MTAMVWRPTTKQLEIIAELGNARVPRADMVSDLAMKRGPSVDFGGYWQRHVV